MDGVSFSNSPFAAPHRRRVLTSSSPPSDHSGRFGLVQINLMRGQVRFSVSLLHLFLSSTDFYALEQMGITNAQRTLNYIRTLTEFISQPQYSDVVQMFGVLNEPFIPDIGARPMESL